MAPVNKVEIIDIETSEDEDSKPDLNTARRFTQDASNVIPDNNLNLAESTSREIDRLLAEHAALDDKLTNLQPLMNPDQVSIWTRRKIGVKPISINLVVGQNSPSTHHCRNEHSPDHLALRRVSRAPARRRPPARRRRTKKRPPASYNRSASSRSTSNYTPRTSNPVATKSAGAAHLASLRRNALAMTSKTRVKREQIPKTTTVKREKVKSEK